MPITMDQLQLVEVDSFDELRYHAAHPVGYAAFDNVCVKQDIVFPETVSIRDVYEKVISACDTTSTVKMDGGGTAPGLFYIHRSKITFVNIEFVNAVGSGVRLTSAFMVRFQHSAFRNCTAARSPDGTLKAENSGCLRMVNSVAQLTDVSFEDCAAPGGGASSVGGGVWSVDSTLSINGASFSRCSASKGGAVMLSNNPESDTYAPDAEVTLTSVSWHNNTATYTHGDPGADVYIDLVNAASLECVPGCLNAGMRMRNGGCQYPVAASAALHGGTVTSCASTCASAVSDCTVCGR